MNMARPSAPVARNIPDGTHRAPSGEVLAPGSPGALPLNNVHRPLLEVDWLASTNGQVAISASCAGQACLGARRGSEHMPSDGLPSVAGP